MTVVTDEQRDAGWLADGHARADLAEKVELLLRREAIAFFEVQGSRASVLTVLTSGARRQIALTVHPESGRPRLVRITVEVVE